MRPFLRSPLGRMCLLGFCLLMGLAGARVATRRIPRSVPTPIPAAAGVTTAPTPVETRLAPASATPPATAKPAVAVPGNSPSAAAAPGWANVAEDAAFLERYYALDRRARDDQDRQGVPVTRRRNARTPSSAGHITTENVMPTASTVADPPPMPTRATLRLAGHAPPAPPGVASAAVTAAERREEPAGAPAEADAASPPAPAAEPAAPRRFNPYGSVLKCELVFTIDSANEEAPLVGLVMEPVYNNGELVIPAGAELHGVARPDRLRDRILSGQDWVLVFPRESSGRISGRQLNVRGVALDREADANGLTWGLTDGSLGLQGQILRSMDGAKIKRFLATFLGEGAIALQQHQTDDRGHDSVRATPQNAVLQGLSADLEQIANDIAQEVAQHGVFIRVPAGHQFYFYPMQTIDADRAGISSDRATLK